VAARDEPSGTGIIHDWPFVVTTCWGSRIANPVRLRTNPGRDAPATPGADLAASVEVQARLEKVLQLATPVNYNHLVHRVNADRLAASALTL
jgi:hypothetical protein